MAKCYRCGDEISENSKYCSNCGTQLEDIIKNKGKTIHNLKMIKECFLTKKFIGVCFAVIFCVALVELFLTNETISEGDAYRIACDKLNEEVAELKADIVIGKDIECIDVGKSGGKLNILFWNREYFFMIPFELKDQSYYATAYVQGTKINCVYEIEDIDGSNVEKWVQARNEEIDKEASESVAYALTSNAQSFQDIYNEFDARNRKNGKNIQNENNQNRSENTHDALDPLILNADKCYLEDVYDLTLYSTDELKKIRNGIYAKHGYIFTDSELAEYFSHKEYYTPTVKKSEWKESVLNEYEKANVQTLLEYENGDVSSQEDTSDSQSESSGGQIALKDLFKCVISDKYVEQDEDQGFIFVTDYNEALERGLKAEYIGDEEGNEIYEVSVPGEYYSYDYHENAYAEYKVCFYHRGKEIDEEDGEKHSIQYYLRCKCEYYYFDED